MRVHESAVRADLQQYYGIDIDRARRGEHSPWHVACLLVELPSDARTRVAFDSDAMWTLDAQLLAGLYNALTALMYGMSNPKRRGNPPEQVGPSWMKRKSRRALPAQVLPASELMEILNKPRG